MKVIFSRKGYDSQYGRYPSIIWPSGEMISFPIPVSNEIGIKSEDLSFKNKNLKEIFADLKHKTTEINHHLDPDIGIYRVCGNPSQAVGLFGQSGKATGHLKKQSIASGDIFLFFGTFRHAELHDGNICYKKNSLSFHALYGYLIVDEIITDIEGINERIDYHRLLNHPHYLNRKYKAYHKNQIYLSSKFGAFNYSPKLKLTKDGENKSVWGLPTFFKDIKITFHNEGSGQIKENQFVLNSTYRGQDFVFEANKDSENWIKEVLSHQNDI